MLWKCHQYNVAHVFSVTEKVNGTLTYLLQNMRAKIRITGGVIAWFMDRWTDCSSIGSGLLHGDTGFNLINSVEFEAFFQFIAIRCKIRQIIPTQTENGLWCLTPLSTLYQLYRFDGGGNRSTRRKLLTCRKSLTNFTYEQNRKLRMHDCWNITGVLDFKLNIYCEF